MTTAPTDYDPTNFANRRHIGPSPRETEEMLRVLGVGSLDELIDQTVPDAIRQTDPLDTGKALSEAEWLSHMRKVAGKNKVLTSFIGQGYHGTHTPAVIARNIFENPAWYTSYTPYQPEISQGRLEALLNFQTMISDLTALPVANSSLLDEATACAEAMSMARRGSKSKSTKFFVDQNCHPQNLALIKTRAKPLGVEVIVGNPHTGFDAAEYFGALFQYPGTDGQITDFTSQIDALHEARAIAVVSADPLALTLLKAPGEMGADIAVGTTQRFGVPLGYGGPHAAYMACTDALKRSMPGRIVGVSIDARGDRALRLALQTREQHIRREKATSNVCTAQALLAVMAGFYAVFHGPEGLRAIARRVHSHTASLAGALRAGGMTIANDSFFDTITVETGEAQDEILGKARAAGMNLRKRPGGRVGVSFDETTTSAHVETLCDVFGVSAPEQTHDTLPKTLLRQSAILEHEVFHMNRSETEIMRYMRRLADRDLALDRAMIPLGSCTMKLNAAAEMIPLSWPELANIHPFVPKDQAEGYAEMIEDLSAKLCEVTGYDGFSMQPNSGAQGEYAGLLAIASYLEAKGEGQRRVCLIPTNAHGTNPASASMVGWKVVPIKGTERGDIDLDDFRAKAEKYSGELAATMITYPSTHGVFEATVKEVCEITHAHGGQVYIDGANMNAMVGISRPGDLGGDVSHLNLHKTFAIPHGGGGPGMGPIGVKEHLMAHLPGHPETDGSEFTVSAAPYGSASILAISWGYVQMMGEAGLPDATKYAILNANYIAKRLAGAFEVLFTGDNDRVAHECILDTRPFAQSAQVTVDDIAKRLIDSGFHAPTMSWPVAGTLMVEPTESESKSELDRFCDAMLSIRAEIAQIEAGDISHADSPLAHAPHTIEDMVGEWTRPYPREVGCFPAGAHRRDKYWPSVGRVDNAYGDRHLVCTCPPMEDYAD